MLEHGIEWEQKGEHKEHLSVLGFKQEKRKEEIVELEQTLERVQQKQVSVQAVEQIEAKPLPQSSKVAVEREDYQALVTVAQKFVAQEKQEGKLKKLLKEAKKTIADMKAKIELLWQSLQRLRKNWQNTSPSVVSSAQRIWSKRMIGFVKRFAPMRMLFLTTICGRIFQNTKQEQQRKIQ